MVTVNELYEDIKVAIAAGHGELNVHAIHGASGVAYDPSFGGVSEKQVHHDAGSLCDEENGTKFYSAYLD